MKTLTDKIRMQTYYHFKLYKDSEGFRTAFDKVYISIKFKLQIK